MVQPAYTGDVAALEVEAGSRTESFVADAVGPETLTCEELLRLLAMAVGTRVRLVQTPRLIGSALTW